MNMNVLLYLTDIEKNEKIMFDLSPDIITGYETCAWSNEGKHTIIRLIFTTYQEWVINITQKTAFNIISQKENGIIHKTYKFEKLIIN